MKCSPFLSLVICLGTGILGAQTKLHSTLPAGLLQRGGDYDDGRGIAWPFYGNFHYQEVHTSWYGKAKLLFGVSFRRAWGFPTANGAVARTVDIEFKLGYGNLHAFGNRSLGSNYNSAPTTVHPRRSVSLPSWVNPPKQAPAPFDAKIPFAGLFVYNGKEHLVWEIRVSQPSVIGGGYRCDRQLGQNYLYNAGTPVGVGCIPNGQTGAHSLLTTVYNYGPGQEMMFYANSRQGPARSGVTLALGVSNTTTKIPGWCSPVYLAPLAYISMDGPAGPTNSARAAINSTYTPSAIGMTFYAQAFAKDQNAAGISLSNATKNVMPPVPILQTWKYVLADYRNPSNLQGPYTYGSLITGWW